MAKIIKKINRNHVLPEFYLAKAGKRVPLLIWLPVGAVNTGNTQNRLALAIKDYLACKWPCNKLSGSFYSGLPGGNRKNNKCALHAHAGHTQPVYAKPAVSVFGDFGIYLAYEYKL